MTRHKTTELLLLAALFLAPSLLPAQTTQEEHDRAVREQTAKDPQHHTGAKIVGGSAAGGAVAGALVGGPKGAVIGGAVGAGGGAVANKIRKDKAVDKRQQHNTDRDEQNYDHPH